jgi:hypothetical protein
MFGLTRRVWPIKLHRGVSHCHSSNAYLKLVSARAYLWERLPYADAVERAATRDAIRTMNAAAAAVVTGKELRAVIRQ